MKKMNTANSATQEKKSPEYKDSHTHKHAQTHPKKRFSSYSSGFSLASSSSEKIPEDKQGNTHTDTLLIVVYQEEKGFWGTNTHKETSTFVVFFVKRKKIPQEKGNSSRKKDSSRKKIHQEKEDSRAPAPSLGKLSS